MIANTRFVDSLYNYGQKGISLTITISLSLSLSLSPWVSGFRVLGLGFGVKGFRVM